MSPEIDAPDPVNVASPWLAPAAISSDNGNTQWRQVFLILVRVNAAITIPLFASPQASRVARNMLKRRIFAQAA
ncbi:MAG: hypothetical protein KA316_23065 [Rhodoferax sp.]|nr:hypothetical protein [Rhodoferax sp.]